MITVPRYKEIYLQAKGKEEIKAQLNLNERLTGPLVIHISHFLDDQLEVLSLLEEILEPRGFLHFPYPVFIISTENFYRGNLTLLKDKKSLPKFWQDRKKSPNVKELQIVKKIELIRLRLNAILNLDTKIKLDEYTKAHKKLYKYAREGNFLEILKTKIIKGKR